MCLFPVQETHHRLLIMLEPFPQFKSPPIKEAIFGITFKEAVEGYRLTQFLNTDIVKERFPNIIPGMMLEVSADEKTAGIKTAHKPAGYQLRSANENSRLLDIKPTQLTYHNLTKYDGWDVMIEELKGLWSAFCLSVGKTQLSQLSVRYINHIMLPLPMSNGFGEYIKLLPQVPEGISPTLNNFFLQINIPVADDAHATATETILGPQPGGNKLDFLLDLIVVKNGNFDCNETEMWDAFIELRAHKNNLFSSCITEKTKELFSV